MATLNLTITTTAAQDSGLQYQWASRTTVQPANPGTGYAVGNILTMSGGTGTAATYRVTSVDQAGAVTGVELVSSGSYTIMPTSPMLTTGGAGTGCRLRNAYADHTAMLTDFMASAVGDYRRQWRDAQRTTLAAAVENATNVQLTNAATAPGDHAAMTDTTRITAEELAYLTTLAEQERTTMNALRAARQSYEAHLAARYRLLVGDKIENDGQIVRSADSAPQQQAKEGE